MLGKYINIDKIKVKGLTIESFNPVVLRLSPKVETFATTLSSDGIQSLNTIVNESEYITRLTINDCNVFNTLYVDYTKKGGYQVYMDISAIEEGALNNLEGLHSTQEFKDKLIRAIDVLYNDYGLLVSYDNLKLHSIELNITPPPMKEGFNDYIHLYYAIDKKIDHNKYRDRMDYKTYEDANDKTIYFKSKRQQLKLYNKSAQLKKEAIYGSLYEIADNIMRLEYTLYDSKNKIEEALGITSPFDLNDDIIITFLEKNVHKDIIRPIENYILASRIIVDKLFQKHYQLKQRGYLNDVIKELLKDASTMQDDNVVKLFDISIIYDSMKAYNINSTYNRRKVRDSFPADYEGNMERLEEFKVKFYDTIIKAKNDKNK